jgi:hypothetical protein
MNATDDRELLAAAAGDRPRCVNSLSAMGRASRCV